jgi:NADH:ubiquinone oxidoreductase subunit 2 (subunit N)
VAVLIRLSGMGDSAASFAGLLVVMAVLSMTYGNLSALAQNDIKRLLGFSSISHAGYMITGILTGTVNGYAGAMYYVGGYLLMNLAIFHVIYALSPNGENVSVSELKGLYRRSPLLAFTLAVGAFGLAGIPPTAGFAGKFFVLTAAFQKGYTWLVILAAINTAISVFYYLKLVRAAYSPEEGDSVGVAGLLDCPVSTKVLGVAFSAAILIVGSMPGEFLDLFRHALSWVG